MSDKGGGHMESMSGLERAALLLAGFVLGFGIVHDVAASRDVATGQAAVGAPVDSSAPTAFTPVAYWARKDSAASSSNSRK
jgi:hypothetical protein